VFHAQRPRGDNGLDPGVYRTTVHGVQRPFVEPLARGLKGPVRAVSPHDGNEDHVGPKGAITGEQLDERGKYQGHRQPA
jgi:hypothetical protein